MHSYTRIRDFHASRARGVGASDIPTLALLNLRYGSTPYQIWEIKTGRKPPWAGNEKTWWGHVHENSALYRWVLDHYDAETATRFLVNKIRQRSTGPLKVRTEFHHPAYRFALAHPDLLVEDNPLLVQAKSHTFFAAKRKHDPDYGYDPEDTSQNGIPASVFLQEQWELFCAGLQEAWVAVLSNTSEYGCYGPIVADPRAQEKCLALAERFMWHVDHDEPPKPETWADVTSMFPEIQATTAMVSGDTELEVRRMVERKERLSRAEKRIKGELADLKNAVGLIIGGNKVLASADGDVLARASDTGRWYLHEARKLEQMHPRIFRRLRDEGYLSESTWRNLYF